MCDMKMERANKSDICEDKDWSSTWMFKIVAFWVSFTLLSLPYRCFGEILSEWNSLPTKGIWRKLGCFNSLDVVMYVLTIKVGTGVLKNGVFKYFQCWRYACDCRLRLKCGKLVTHSTTPHTIWTLSCLKIKDSAAVLRYIRDLLEELTVNLRSSRTSNHGTLLGFQDLSKQAKIHARMRTFTEIKKTLNHIYVICACVISHITEYTIIKVSMSQWWKDFPIWKWQCKIL